VYSLTIDEKYCGVGIKMSWVELNPKELTIGRGGGLESSQMIYIT